MKRVFIILFLVFCLGSSSFAEVQYVAPELLAEQKLLENNLRENSKSAEAYFELAMSYAYTGWIEIAWDHLKQIPKYHKKYEDIVISKYTKKIKKDPNNWKHHFKLAFGYYFQDKKDLALKNFEKAHSLEPKQVWVSGFIALLLGEKKKYKECIKVCNNALKIDPKATAIHFLLAEAYYKTGNYFGFLGESFEVLKLKSIEAKYRPVPPIKFEDNEN